MRQIKRMNTALHCNLATEHLSALVYSRRRSSLTKSWGYSSAEEVLSFQIRWNTFHLARLILFFSLNTFYLSSFWLSWSVSLVTSIHTMVKVGSYVPAIKNSVVTKDVRRHSPIIRDSPKMDMVINRTTPHKVCNTICYEGSVVKVNGSIFNSFHDKK